jgi:maltooligosyltrehalose trehalohydrolase
VANPSFGLRVHQIASPGRYRALTALTLLGPATPLLFQGQEFASSSPFHFFVDHHGALREAIVRGRRQFMSQFPGVEAADVPGPDDEATFRRCVLDWAECDANGHHLALHRDLLTMRRTDAGIASASRRRVDGAVLGADAFLVRYDAGGPDDRLLLVNLGADLEMAALAEPLLAPPAGRRWSLVWSSEDPAYGGAGLAAPRLQPSLSLPPESALLFRGEEPSNQAEEMGVSMQIPDPPVPA